MNSLKCPRCGLVRWANAAACKRCGAVARRVDAPARPAAPGRPSTCATAPPPPGWVGLGLFGIKSRRGAMAWLVGSALLIPAMCFALFFLMVVLAGMGAPAALAVAALVGVPSLFAPLRYWLSIRWMDAHGASTARD